MADTPAELNVALREQALILECRRGSNNVVDLESSNGLQTPWTLAQSFIARDSVLQRKRQPAAANGFFQLRTPLATGPLQRVPNGAGGVILDLPVGQHGPYANQPKVAPGIEAPVPTCSWWSSAVWDFGDDRPYGFPMYAWPLGYQVSSNGVSLGLPGVKAISTYEYHWEFVRGSAGELPLRIAVDGMETPTQTVTGWGDWTVSLRLANDRASMDYVLGMGLPMAWFSSRGGNLSVHPAGGSGLQVWRKVENELGLQLFGVNYLLLAPEGSTWNNSAPYQPIPPGPVTLAVVPDTNAPALARFRNCAPPLDSRVSWDYDETTSTLTTRYELEVSPGTKPPPMALFPHQWTLTTASTTDAYDSARGRMKLVDGGSFTTQQTFPGLVPHLPLPVADELFDTNVLNAFLDEVSADQLPTGADTYGFGKALWRMASLIPIARQAGRHGLADAWLGRVKAALEDWFDGEEPNLFRYDRTWSTAYGFPAGFETNGLIQDHHFHWSYFIQSAALVAREDPTWAEAYGSLVEFLIRDTANWQRGDATFPFLNSFEPYAGHAWANGPAMFHSGNNQESSSESIHFAAGVFQWGLATGRTDIRDLGLFLYSTETEAIHRYWLNHGNLAFPDAFNWPVLGILWGNGGAYATWFGGYPDHIAFIHGINFLPVTPASLHLGRDPEHFLSTLAPLNTDPAEWFDIITCARATADPADAALRLAENPGYQPFDGNTRAYTYYWVHALRQLGTTTSITANQPSAMVLSRNGTRSYIVWNPTSSPITAKFSDGTLHTQPPGSMGMTQKAP